MIRLSTLLETIESPLRTREELFQEAKAVLSENERLKEFEQKSPYRIFIPLFKGGNSYIFFGKSEEAPKWPVATFSIERRKEGVKLVLEINARSVEGDLEVLDWKLENYIIETMSRFQFLKRAIRNTVTRLIAKPNPAFKDSDSTPEAGFYASIFEPEYLNEEEIDREVEAGMADMGYRYIRRDNYLCEILPPIEAGNIGYAKIKIGIVDVGHDDLGDVCANIKTILYFQKVKF